MWKVARTKDGHSSPQRKEDTGVKEPTFLGRKVPTNAFQQTMLDGVTVPSAGQRVGSFLAPMPPLFRMGVLVGLFGYGTTFCTIWLRTLLVPSFVAATQTTNVLYASLYTGAFLAIVSNVRYQLLQGVVEPLIDYYLRRIPMVRDAIIFVVRIGNGLLGSLLAISGMRRLGLQCLK